MSEETPYAVFCHGLMEGVEGCGKQYLSEQEYTRQMMRPNSTWQCPSCGSYDCTWDDENYEKHLPIQGEDDYDEEMGGK